MFFNYNKLEINFLLNFWNKFFYYFDLDELENDDKFFLFILVSNNTLSSLPYIDSDQLNIRLIDSAPNNNNLNETETDFPTKVDRDFYVRVDDPFFCRAEDIVNS